MALPPGAGLASRANTQVLIVGAGPTGLVLALWLTRLGARVRIIDKAAQSATTSRAVQNAVYLLRPDGYVGLAADAEGAAALSSYLDARRLGA